ncbi:DNA-binding transcriptional regulator, XRE-family HTH domain [Lactobacillus bombicola]|uniref:DNA-binding transcriptional regulator, XRE-family HTH domain n=1 Tax=Lactobacillus bombicola TaxID=1505723 RepID=A0A1I1RI45_9LACO|nr:helix-turn-helix transcriptional regulator [Lactobacillus bombicola]MCO6528763.1 helix-turn-helix transcriptional regulator [Lactobacillus sp.]SFD31313.1 DNA-binding transcriptional regulator, XRE-family HTH domain [Lactobacillus bombicola]
MALLDTVKIMAKKHGYSLTELNEKAGLGKNTIYSWKTKTPSTENLQKVAKVLHTSTDYLLGNTDDPSPANNEGRKNIDISNTDNIYSYNGQPVPEEYLDVIRNLMDSDFRKGRKNGKFD